MEKESTERKFYPERPGANIDSAIQILSKNPEFTPTEEERRKALTVDSGLTRGVDLYSTFNIENPNKEKARGVEQIYLENKVNTLDFFVEYFTSSSDGFNELKNLGFEPKEKEPHEDEVVKFLSGFDYSSIDASKIAKIAGNSKNFVQDSVVKKLEENKYESLDGLEVPTKVTIVKNPDALASRMQELRDLKTFLKKYSKSENAVNSPQIKAIVDMHQRRVNELIVDCYPEAVALAKQHKNAPKKESKDAIEKIAKSTNVISFESSDMGEFALSRLDKYLNGAGEKIEDNYYSPISEDAENLADNVRKRKERRSFGQDRGKYDRYKKYYENATANSEDMHAWIKKVLGEYEILSESPESEYSPDRAGRAPDKKWQVIQHPTSTSLSIDGAQGAVKIPPEFERTLTQISPAGIVPGIEHELEHVVQWENKGKMGLSLTEVVGVDRSDVYSEAGGIMWEAEAQKELFGQERDTNVDYITASERKLQGGNYLDCVKAFFDSNMKMRKNTEEEKLKAANLAADRVLRLFRKEGVLDDEKRFLANSQPLVYLEQDLVTQKLKEAKKEYLLHYGINLDVLADLHRVGMVNVSKVWVPEKKPSKILEKEIEDKFKEASSEKN